MAMKTTLFHPISLSLPLEEETRASYPAADAVIQILKRPQKFDDAAADGAVVPAPIATIPFSTLAIVESEPPIQNRSFPASVAETVPPDALNYQKRMA
jgi:hypothetical protein